MMSKEFEEKIIPFLEKALEEYYPCGRWENGEYLLETFRCYDDAIPLRTVADILRSDCPEDAFEDVMVDMDLDYGLYHPIGVSDLPLSDSQAKMLEGQENEADEWLSQTARYVYSRDEFLGQRVACNLILGTRKEADRGFRDCAAFRGGEPFHDDCVLAVIAENLGCKEELIKMIETDCICDTCVGFAASAIREMLHYTGSGPRGEVTVLANLRLGDLIRLQICRKTDKGTIRIRKNAVMGIFDPVTGGGGLFEMRLDRDVILPVGMVQGLWPEGAKLCAWDVNDVFDLADSAWKEDAVVLCAMDEFFKREAEPLIRKALKKMVLSKTYLSREIRVRDLYSCLSLQEVIVLLNYEDETRKWLREHARFANKAI